MKDINVDDVINNWDQISESENIKKLRKMGMDKFQEYAAQEMVSAFLKEHKIKIGKESEEARTFLCNIFKKALEFDSLKLVAECIQSGKFEKKEIN